MNAIVQRLMQNKHTSIAVAVYVGSLFLVRFLEIWITGHDAQFASTEELIKGAAVSYGLLMAGDQRAAGPDSGPAGGASQAGGTGQQQHAGVITRHSVL
jgi:hypothetical protein